MTLASLLLVHGDDPRMELVYFIASVLLALTPVIVLGTIGVLVLRKVWRERESQRGTRNAEGGTDARASVPRSDFRVPR
jgi:hypothetical protein